jgi:hypothetical protein
MEMTVLLAVALAIMLATLGLLIFAMARRRNRIIRAEGMFRCKVRLVQGRTGGVLSCHWPRRSGYAIWAHDVLILHRGLALTEIVALVCQSAQGTVAGRTTKVPGMGPTPHVLRLELDDRTLVEVAALRGEREHLAGPYVSALFGPPSAPDRLPPA